MKEWIYFVKSLLQTIRLVRFIPNVTISFCFSHSPVRTSLFLRCWIFEAFVSKSSRTAWNSSKSTSPWMSTFSQIYQSRKRRNEIVFTSISLPGFDGQPQLIGIRLVRRLIRLKVTTQPTFLYPLIFVTKWDPDKVGSLPGSPMGGRRWRHPEGVGRVCSRETSLQSMASGDFLAAEG